MRYRVNGPVARSKKKKKKKRKKKKKNKKKTKKKKNAFACRSNDPGTRVRRYRHTDAGRVRKKEKKIDG